MEYEYDVLVGKPEGKKQPGRSRDKWEGSIKLDLRGMGRVGMHWIHWAQGRD
jgi:hypothetical protein